MIVIYHANCPDGFCAAWLLNKAYPDAVFMPYNYGTPPPDVKGHDVIMADFSFPRPIMEQIIADAKSVVVLDHHKTARDELAGLEDHATIVFDMERSGGKITADFLFGLRLIGASWADSWLVWYTQDRDLWQWKLENTKELNAAISLRPFDFLKWDALHYADLFTLRAEGSAILKYQQNTVDKAVPNAVLREISGYVVPVLNTTTLISEIGNVLCERHPFSATYFDTDGRRVWSLRASRSSSIDVSVIAELYGGGGHPKAAGFTQPIDWIPPQEK